MCTFGLAFAIALALAFAGGAALADRPVTEEERAQLVAALQAEGCSGGTMEFDDDEFEVEDATCADGRRYELDFDRSFRLIEKEVEDD